MNRIFINKQICLGQSVLEIGEIIIYDQNMQKRAKLSDMDTDSFIAYIKTEDIYSDIAKDV